MTTSLMDSKSSCVEAYTGAGFTLFPCGAGPTQKQPLRKEWKDTAHNDELTADQLPDIYGVGLANEDCVLDVDPKRFIDGADQLKMLWKALNLESPNTLVVKTPGGGWHLYYKMPAGEKVRANMPGHNAIEIKTKGKYVIGAGSEINGAQYTVIRGSAATIQRIPHELLDFIRADDTQHDVGVESDDDNAKSRFTQYLMHVAQPAISGMGGDTTTFKAACEGRDYGLSEAAVFMLMLDYYNPRCQPEWRPDDLRRKVANAFAYARGAAGKDHPLVDFDDIEVPQEAKKPKHVVSWECDPKGGYKCTLNNLINFFYMPGEHPELSGLVKFNKMSRSIEFNRKAPWHDVDDKLNWDDIDNIMLKHHLGSRASGASTNLIYEVARAVAHHNQYHPIQDWLNGLRWDGKPRLDKLLVTYAGADDNAYTRAVGKCTLIAACARVMQPGVQHDHMLVLEGPQGSGKSTFVRTLGGPWYADIIMDPHSKDTVCAMVSSWIIECSEMEVTRRADVSALKSFLTKVVDKVRLPYERTACEIPRQQAFIGTVNPDGSGYLKDSTGNRRFWPVTTRRIDTLGLKRDREQIFAEAITRYRSGEAHHLTSTYTIEMAKIEQARRAQEDPWDDVIGAWLATGVDPAQLTTEFIAYGALMLPMSKMDRTAQGRLASAMKALGYVNEKMYCAKTKGTVRKWVKEQDELEGL